MPRLVHNGLDAVMAEPIIGRRTELQALARFLEAVPAGGQALLIEGDAGIGKTALLQQGVHDAQARGFRALTARPASAEAQMAFATIGDLLGPTLDETLPSLPGVQRRALETALLLRGPEGPPPEARVLGVALVSAVHALVQERPLLVALDDVQWVDASSAEMLGFMLRRLDGQPVAVLATVRGRPVQAPLDLDRAFVAFERLPLEPLSVGAIHRLLSERLALNLPRPTLVRVYEAAGGNPFYALELGRALIDGTIGEGGGVLSLPESLESIVADRLDRLPTRVRETLVAVAALAVPTVPMLEPLSASAVDDIERARSRGVLALDGDRIHFTHPLLAPASYSRMPLHRRRRLHRRLADLDVDLEERARHLAIAVVGADEEVAAALDEGAAHACARGATLAAAELAELAVAVTPADAVDQLNRRRIGASEHCMYAGDTARASGLLEAAVGSSEPGAVRAKALRRLAWCGGRRRGSAPPRPSAFVRLPSRASSSRKGLTFSADSHGWRALEAAARTGFAMRKRRSSSQSRMATRSSSRPASRPSPRSRFGVPGASDGTCSTVRSTLAAPPAARRTRRQRSRGCSPEPTVTRKLEPSGPD